ncbi:prospero homeobox protein 2 [Microcaecilia unicolor]|uniref:Prospero homeobox protein 2 n=1 Tax=Microcaecilia unicolor TaxID=1415580 RepID=A0A6P7YYI1_9AMPH|nr:prospero homeobox protein 2 [Microcaecilia unicolor]
MPGKTMEPNCCFMPSKVQSTFAGSASTVQDREGNSFVTQKSQDPGCSFSQATIPSVSNRLYSEHMKAKKARVESIVRGMKSSFNKEELFLQGHNQETEQLAGLEREDISENKRKRKIPQQQNESLAEQYRTDYECYQLSDKRWVLEKQLRQLQERLFQVHYLSDVEHSQEEKKAKCSPNRNENCDMNKSHQGDFVWRTVSEMETHKRLQGDNNGLSLQEKRLSEMLKRELLSAITHIVDSVMKKVLLKESGHLAWTTQSLRPSSTIFGENRRELIPAAELSQKENFNRAEQQSMNQTKTPALAHTMNSFCDICSQFMNPKEISTSYQTLQMPYLMSMKDSVQENKVLTQLLGHTHSLPSISSNSVDMRCTQTIDQEWEDIKVMSPVSSRDPLPAQQKKSRSRKTECADSISTVDGIHYTSAHVSFIDYKVIIHIQAGRFSRCITSQLIKWFSNFREFYYMQMEKFARQASVEGIDPKDLTMSRDSDLFQALNMHYNKANDFQVPEQFLNTATVTLREFFSAVNTGKDLDPSWKKSIYKIICKLDSDIPEVFKSPTYPHGIH